MRIAFLTDDFPPKNLGGAGNVASNLARGFTDQGHEVFVITTVQRKEDAGFSIENGLKLFRIYSYYHARWRAYLSIWNPQTVPALKRILGEIKPDIVHAHNVHLYLSYAALKVARLHAKGVFLTAHDAMTFHYGKLMAGNYKVGILDQLKQARLRYNPLRDILIRHYLGYVDRIFAVSAALQEALRANGILNVEVIHNGIERNEWRVGPEAVSEFRKAHRLSGAKVILFGGRVSSLKGGEVLPDIFKSVAEKVPAAKLLVIGDKHAAENALGRLTKEYAFEDRVCFAGWLHRNEVMAAYSASDVVIVPSIYLDPFPNVILEAMASRKPLVATSLGGAREAVQDGVTGYIENPMDTRAFADKVVVLLKDESLARRFGEAGFARVGEALSLGEQVRKTLACYNLILDAYGRTAQN